MSAATPVPDADGEAKRTRFIRRRRVMSVVALPALLLLRRLAEETPELVECVYSRGVFPVVQSTLSTVAGWLPFSGGEAMTGLLVLALLWGIVHTARRTWRAHGRRWRVLGGAAADGLGLASLLYALFLLSWGLNFSRVTLPQHLDLDLSQPTLDEVAELAAELVETANRERAGLAQDADGHLVIEGGTETVFEELQRIHGYLPARYPQYAGGGLTPRVPALSMLLSNARISGIYWPFTGEMHVNGELPASSLPFVACHEASHAWGVPREDEANLMAALVCRESDSALFRYSGAVTSLAYVGNALSAVDRGRARAVLDGLSPAVRRDRKRVWEFWSRSEGALAPVAQASNDAYLKSQGQTQGVRSYGAVVDLLVAERRRRTSRLR